jgi:DNA-binding NarL/FixJ family response regulator
MSHPSQNAEEQLQEFAEYIRDRKIVIVDQNTTSRVGLARQIAALGAVGSNIRTAGSYEEGVKEIEDCKPHIVICDYDLGNRSGLELIQSLKKQTPDYNSSLFIMVTGNTSQSAVAQAAEEDVDTYILKPYTINIFRQNVLKAAMAKIYPSEYANKIEQGKKLLFDLKPTEAKVLFIEAKKLNPKPALACFYEGQADLMIKALVEAEGAFNQGLNYNKIHYKCLTGLFDLFMEKKNIVDAYEVVKRISRYFPANPQRLAQVLRLAIMTRSYDDVERYYQSFINLDARNEELVKYICAALVVCGKHYLSTNTTSRGLELFRKASVTGVGKVKILREIILALAEYDMHKEARDYLVRFPAEIQSGVDFQAMKYLVNSDSQSPSITISMGRELISKGVMDPVIYQVLIKKSIEQNYFDPADVLIQEALNKWPDQKNVFEKLKKQLQESKKT